MKKGWMNPQIKEIAIKDTAYSTINGQVPDLYTTDCEKDLYDLS